MKRGYVMTARAAAAEATADRIVKAAFQRLATTSYDEVRLDDVAGDAGVTVQTVIRRFGSKESLARAVNEAYARQLAAESLRSQTRLGDVDGAASSVVAQYEESGDLLLHLLRQEASVAVYAEFLEFGRQTHRQWCREVFSPHLASRTGVDRERLLAQIAAVCDLYTWFLLRRQQGLSRRQTIEAISELLQGVLR